MNMYKCMCIHVCGSFLPNRSDSYMKRVDTVT